MGGPDKGQVVVTGHLDFARDNLDTVKSAFGTHVALSREEEGCLIFDTWDDPDDPGRVHLWELYRDMAAFDAHRARTGASAWPEAGKDVTPAIAVREIE